VVPHTQRSWIGKAHFAGQTLSTTYIYPTNEGNDFKGPFPTSQKDLLQEGFKEWKLVDGTPASCADIGINHLNDGKPVDLVISGPNFGRNTSAVYITSSGTVGAAMEAANLGKRSVGISFGFETRKTDQDIVDEASRIGTHLIKHLVDNWSNEVDLYTINIPLFKDLKLNETRIHYAPVLANKWRTLFAKVDNSSGDDAEEDIVDLSSIHNQIQFRWKPDFHAVHQSVLESKARGEHNDGVVLGNNEISYVPCK
jgi:5'/3'-nucleotidase SurE